MSSVSAVTVSLMSRMKPTKEGGSPSILVLVSSTGKREPSERIAVSRRRCPSTATSPVSM